MNFFQRRGLCLVLAAPSGGGKTALARRLVASEENISLSISCTTRAPRAGERDGVDYFFCSQEKFEAMVRDGGLLESAKIFDHFYGTPRAPVEAALSAGQDIVFDIDWQGHRSLRAALPGDVVGTYILPPSLEVLATRLRGRGDDEQAIARRMVRAAEEMSHWAEFDHVVLNDDFESALMAVRAILRAARSATARLTGLADFVARLNS